MELGQTYKIKGIEYILTGLINKNGWCYVFENQDRKQLIINVYDKIETE